MNISNIVAAVPPFCRRHKLVQLLTMISPDSRVQIVHFNNHAKLFADISDPNPRNYFLTKSFEPEFFSIAKPFLSSGGTFFDIGANFGFCSFGMMGCLPQANINYHLFEANINIYNILLNSASLHPSQKIAINHCCVCDRKGISMLNLLKNHLGGSFISSKGKQKVNNLLLDEYISDKAIDKINFMKMDIEGFEPLALKGCINSLAKGIVDSIYMEISATNLSRSGFSANDCFTLLKDTGFHVFYCKPADFDSNIIDKSKAFTLNIHGYSVMVANLDDFPLEHQTDILAIHKKSNFL